MRTIVAVLSLVSEKRCENECNTAAATIDMEYSYNRKGTPSRQQPKADESAAEKEKEAVRQKSDGEELHALY